MSLREVLYYRTTQWLTRKVILRKWLFFNTSNKLELKKNFKTDLYTKKEIQSLFACYPWRFDYNFFETKVLLNREINWLKDYHNKIISNQKYYANINGQDYSNVGDVKYVSELNRMHFLPFMAFHYVSNNDSKILKNITTILKTWEAQNPFLKSINYTSGIEVGIRSLNIIYTHLILNSFDALTNDLDTVIKRLIYSNYIFLKNNLSLYSSANNHLVGELMGLVVISSYFDGSNLNQKKWQHKFIQLLKTKYNKDGVDDELSTRYHLAVTDHFLNGLLFLQRSGRIIDEEVIKVFEKSFKYIEHIRFNGVETYFGDNDDSFLINPYFQKDFSLVKSLIGSNDFLYKQSRTVELDFRNYLIFGSHYYNVKIQKRLLPKTTFFEASGLAFIYNHKNGLKLTFDCGNIGDNKLMAHGHSDQLSFNLQLNDFIYIVDTGTYQYHIQKKKWRNYFRSVKAHNTISVNEKNQAIALGRMSWGKASKITRKEFKIQNGIEKITAQIDGFSDEGVLHTRTLIHNSKQQSVMIQDLLEVKSGGSSKKVSFYLHFHPDAKINHQDKIIMILSPDGKKIEVSNNLFENAKLIKGNEEIPLGWFSHSYDNIQETTSLLLELNINDDTTIETLIKY
jgi:hypothetical protein